MLERDPHVVFLGFLIIHGSSLATRAPVVKAASRLLNIPPTLGWTREQLRAVG